MDVSPNEEKTWKKNFNQQIQKWRPKKEIFQWIQNTEEALQVFQSQQSSHVFQLKCYSLLFLLFLLLVAACRRRLYRQCALLTTQLMNFTFFFFLSVQYYLCICLFVCITKCRPLWCFERNLCWNYIRIYILQLCSCYCCCHYSCCCLVALENIKILCHMAHTCCGIFIFFFFESIQLEKKEVKNKATPPWKTLSGKEIYFPGISFDL